MIRWYWLTFWWLTCWQLTIFPRMVYKWLIKHITYKCGLSAKKFIMALVPALPAWSGPLPREPVNNVIKVLFFVADTATKNQDRSSLPSLSGPSSGSTLRYSLLEGWPRHYLQMFNYSDNLPVKNILQDYLMAESAT